EAEMKQWLELADALDYSAKLLIRHCLVQAAQHALDKSQEWVKQAASAGAEDRVEALTVRFLAAENAASDAEDENEECRRRLESRIARLDSFAEMSKKLADRWKAQLEAGPGKPPVADVAEVDTAKTE